MSGDSEDTFVKLGVIVLRNVWKNAEEMMQAAGDPTSDAYWFLKHMCLVRVRRQYGPDAAQLVRCYAASQQTGTTSVRREYQQL